MARVFIGVGHGGADPGAVSGNFRESEINLTMALAAKAELERHGVVVGISRTKEEVDKLAEEIAECNAFAPDVAIEVHNNAGGGDGFEVYTQTNSFKNNSRALATAIESRVKALGQNSRGLHTKLNNFGSDYFGWLRQVTCPAVLLEGFFVDNAKDRSDFDTVAKQQAMGVAYAHGVLDHLNIPVLEAEGEKKRYKIQLGEYDDKAAAEEKLEKVKAAGFIEAFIVESGTGNDSKPVEVWEPKEGDIVMFSGNVHYISADANSGFACSTGKARITRIYKPGKHPYHLVAVDNRGRGPHGWVDAGSFAKI